MSNRNHENNAVVLGNSNSFTKATGKIGTKPEKGSIKKIIPWFAIGFIIVAGFNSLDLLPVATVNSIRLADQFLLAMAMTALGLETHVSKFIQAGIKPLVLALILYHGEPSLPRYLILSC